MTRMSSPLKDRPAALLQTGLRSRLLICGMAVIGMCGGCSGPVSKMMFTNHKNRNPAMSGEKKAERSEEQAHRAGYRSNRSSADLEWLMKNRIENGLTRDSVNNIIGQKGKAVSESDEIAQVSGSSGTTDGVYEYGPDDQGRTYRLTFKNSRLSGFSPTPSMASRSPARADKGSAQVSREENGGVKQVRHEQEIPGRATLSESAE